MKKVQIVKCSNKDLWYKNKKFPINAFVHEASNQFNGTTYNSFFNLNNVNDFYYSNNLMGFISKEDCIDINDLHSYSYIGNKLFDKGKEIEKKNFSLIIDDSSYKTNETKKFDNGKPDFTLIPQAALLELAKVMTHGKEKYGEYNYSNGTSHTRYIAACLRHLNQWLKCEDLDEIGTNHLANAAANCLMALDNILTNKGLDNRNKVYGKSK